MDLRETLSCQLFNPLIFEDGVQSKQGVYTLKHRQARMAERSTIRKAELADATGIKDCVEAAYRGYIPRMGQKPGPMLDDYSQVISSHQVFVLEEEGQVIGVAVLVTGKEGILLDNVAVHPDRQGGGLGRQLIAFAENEALKQGSTSLDLYTHKSMTENIGLYESLGYIETDRRTESGYQRVYMRKSLA